MDGMQRMGQRAVCCVAHNGPDNIEIFFSKLDRDSGNGAFSLHAVACSWPICIYCVGVCVQYYLCSIHDL